MVLCVYLGALHGLPKDVFWHPDEGGKFIGLRTLRWDGGLEYRVPYRGQTLDPRFELYPGACERGALYPSPDAGGGVLFHWPIWFPLLSRSFFETFGIGGIYVLPLVGGWLTALVAGRWVGAADARLVPVATLIVGCATPLMLYSLSFFEHTLATLCGAVAVSALLASRPGTLSSLWRMAPWLLVAVALRLEMIAFVVALVVAWAVARALGAADDAASGLRRRAPPLVPYSVAGGLVLVGVLVVARSLAPRHWEVVAEAPALLARSLTQLPFVPPSIVHVFVGLPPFRHPLANHAWDAVMFLALGAVVMAPFVRSRRLEARLLLGGLGVLAPALTVMALCGRAYLDRPAILTAAPFMVVGFYALPVAWRRRDRRALCLAVAACGYAITGFAALFTTRVGYDGTYLIGQDGSLRYMLTLYPLGVAISVIAVRRFWASDRPAAIRTAVAGFFAVMVVVALAYQVRGVRSLYANKQALRSWQAALAAESRTVTDVWWLPALLAPFFTTHEMYCVCTPAAASAWMDAALQNGIREFTFTTVTPIPPGAVSGAAATIPPGCRDGEGHDVAAPFQGVAQEAQEVTGIRLCRRTLRAEGTATAPTPEGAFD